MKHLRWLPEWPKVPIDPENPSAGERDATKQELLAQYDLVPLGEHADGGWIFDCLGRDGRSYPGRRVSPFGVKRWVNISEGVAQVCWHQTIYRHTSGGDARQSLAQADRTDPSFSEKEQGVLTVMRHRWPDPDREVEAARQLDAAQKMKVPVREVADRDVVETGPHAGNIFAGEPEPQGVGREAAGL